MELYQLRYFARAAKYENISMAAQELHVTQPSISKCHPGAGKRASDRAHAEKRKVLCSDP